MKTHEMMKVVFLASTWMLAVVTGASAQQKRVISGIVICHEEQKPLEGVTIYAKGSSLVTGSQADGMFYLPVENADSILLVQREGFDPREVKIGASNEYKIELLKNRRKEKTIAGSWRGEFLLPEVSIPFRFDIDRQGKTPKAYFINGKERFEAGDVFLKGDSLLIQSSLFDTELALELGSDYAIGVFRKSDGSGKSYPVKAAHGNNDRFPEGTNAEFNITGKYDVLFKQADGSEVKSVGLFTQQGNHLQAVFLKTTGDSRFLEGTLNGDQLKLSSFIGSSPAYYEAEVNKNGTIEGRVRGFGSIQHFIAIRNEQASLPDPYSLTHLKPGYSQFNFNLPTLEGKQVSLKDARYAGKVVVLTLTGSWCPNCMDEATFLGPWYGENKNRGVEIIAIHFERNTEQAYIKKSLTRFKERFRLEYEQVVGGVADKKAVAEAFPALNSFLAFPTTIFIDKKGNVSKIHTGYSGPATGDQYTKFVTDFNAEIDKLLAQ